ncbi:MAG TPA: NAD(P)/FAD-dependent oxidoreductase [candidate division Zixibacteria bacterium]|nr:NAD(P)/FAD-dependent oxidoreductase [candidate division Zixibacteria bacterium]
MSSKIPHVVIVGVGFAGLYAAKALAGQNIRVTLIDRRNHHTFQPLLYQVASAGLSPGEIAVPIRSIFAKDVNVETLLEEVTGVDLQNQRVLMDDDSVDYDYLIVASGATHAYFGHDDWAPLAPGLKTVEDATEIRRRVLLAYEIAERDAQLGKPVEPINLVVVGGGPTGVELAGAMAEIARQVLADDFRAIRPATTRVLLIEAGPRILATYPEDLSRSATEQLRKLGVEVITGTAVTDIAADHIMVGDKRVRSTVVLWGAGVAASPLGKKLGVPTDRAGRVLVSPDLTIPGHINVFVLGDLASVKQPNGRPVPGVAPAAIQMGKYAGQTIIADLHNKPRKPFHYHDKGSLATIGRSAAVGEIGRFHFSGWPAWMAWLLVHIYFLIGFRNRVVVLLQWLWAYVSFSRGARLITGQSKSVVPIRPGVVHEADVSNREVAAD